MPKSFAQLQHDKKTTSPDPEKGQSESPKGLLSEEKPEVTAEPEKKEPVETEPEKKEEELKPEAKPEEKPEEKPGAIDTTATDTKKYRFKSWEEAEKAEEEAKKLARNKAMQVGDLQRHLDEIKNSASTEDKNKIADWNREASKKLRAISSDDPEIDIKQLEIITELNQKIMSQVSESSFKKWSAEQTKQKEQYESACSRIKELLGEKQLKSDQHFKLFLTLQANVMKANPDYNDLPEEKQFGLVYDEMKPLIDHTVEALTDLQKKNDEHKKNHEVMGRGEYAPKQKKEAAQAPTTLSDQINKIKGQRVFKG